MEEFVREVARLREQRGWSASRLVSEASTYAQPGLSPSTIRNAMDGKRRGNGGVPITASPAAIEAICDALGVDPWRFEVYVLGRARQALDPSVVGEERALAAAKAAVASIDDPELSSRAAGAPAALAEQERLRAEAARQRHERDAEQLDTAPAEGRRGAAR